MAGKPRFRGAVPDGQAYCTNCQKCLPVTEFPRQSRKTNGVDSWCRPCRAALARRRREAQPGGWRDHYLQTTFGISERQFAEMLALQAGGCAICGTEVPWGTTTQLKHFAVDHDHSCCPGKTSCGRCVRGLLCNRCNRGLGQFRDDPTILRRAIAYLTTSRGG